MGPVDAEDLGVPLNITPTTSTVSNRFLGKRRAANTVGKYEWLFLGIVSFTLFAVLAITLYRVLELPPTVSEFTLGILVLFNIVFCYVYAYHGVLFEQPNEIGFLVLSTVIILIYSVLGYHAGEIQDSVKTGKLVYMCFIGPIIVILGCQIGYDYGISGNLVFKIVGADPFMQKICRRAQLQIVLLFFDAQAIASCIILVIHAVGISLVQEVLVFCLGCIFIVVWLMIGYFAVLCESLLCMAAFLTLCTVQPSYVVWRLVVANSYQPDFLDLSIVNASGVFFLLIHSYLIVNSIRVYQNFGKGLKEKIFGDQRQTSQYGAVQRFSET
ncbi:uncharacterized protein [Hetaerina americana]|uniref:uncharacterized protein n=1 Tax=Hetaerina americana TaxID=62018 RepID=UPI003A7F4F75